MEEVNQGTTSTQSTEPNSVSPTENGQQSNPTPTVEGGNVQENGAQANVGTQAPNSNEQKPNEGGQSKEENAKFAQLRHQREIDKAKSAGDAEGYKRARIKSVGGKNPYADDTPIETDEDYELYELQDEINASGGDPKNAKAVYDLKLKHEAERLAEIEKNKTDQEKRNEQNAREVKAVYDYGYTQETLRALLLTKEFDELAQSMPNAPLIEQVKVYEKFIKQKPVSQAQINKASSPGSATNTEQSPTPKKISEMTKEEFDRYYEAVKSGKKKI